MFTDSIYMADMEGSGYDIVELRLSHPLTETVRVYVSIMDEGRKVLFTLPIDLFVHANRLQ